MSTEQRPWWVSWYSAGPFEYHGPWWISGFEGGGQQRSTICAAVMASDEDQARQVIVDAHDDEPDIEWRFVDPRTPEWSPFTGRFPRADWMRWPEGQRP